MEWYKYTIRTTEEAEDLVCAVLADLGYTSVEIEDLRPVAAEESGGLFGDVVPDLPEDDGSARISFYTETLLQPEKLLEDLKSGLISYGAPDEADGLVIETGRTAEEDWINNWKEYFHSFCVDDILIEPTWESTRAEDVNASMVLRIDPGTAFGTGAHESTQLAIRALRKYLKEGDRFLDIGTGSGILGIVALKSGASRVFGTDLDENTLPAIADNLEQNDIDPANFTVVLGNIADDPDVQNAAGTCCYDIAAANIIAEILREITPAIPDRLKQGGIYITSGILTEKEIIVAEAAEKAGLSHLETFRQGEWSSMVFRK